MKILLSGHDGAMGKTFVSCYEIAAAYSNQESINPYPSYTNLDDVQEEIDVIIDFSHSSNLETLLEFAVEKKIPLLIATTGISENQHSLIDEACQVIPILQSGNFSKGLNIMAQVAKDLSAVLNKYDIEIVEKHHRYKKDAPSGSAQMLFEAVKEERENAYAVYDRSQKDERRSDNEVGIHSIRAGNIVGEHSLYFVGEYESIEIKHSAYSKEVFVEGAYEAAEYLIKQEAGRYSYEDVIFK